MQKLPGFYRGTVVAVDDPERRGRVRVRIHHIHDEDIPIEHLEWGELGGFFAAKDAVDIPNYDIGDRVWCGFEGGDKRFPVVFGGWVSQYGGVPDLPPEQIGEYAQTRKRWRRQDRAGNYVEWSEVNRELHVKIGSGNSAITVSQRGESIEIEAEGPVNLRGTNIRLDGKQINASADEISSEAGKGLNRLLSNEQVIIGITSNGAGAVGAVDIGAYLDELGILKQTDEVNIRPEDLNLGDSLITQVVTISASGDISVASSSGGTVTLDTIGGVVNIGANATQVNIA